MHTEASEQELVAEAFRVAQHSDAQPSDEAATTETCDM